MNDFLRRQAARDLLYDAGGKLREEIELNRLVDLWLPMDGTPTRNRERGQLNARINQAIASDALKVREHRETVTVHAPPGGFAVSAVDADRMDDHRLLWKRSAARSQVRVTRFVRRDNLRAWLASLGEWPPSPDSALRAWWPDERWGGPAKLHIDQSESLAKKLGSANKADKQVAADTGKTAGAIKKARQRANPKSTPGKPMH